MRVRGAAAAVSVAVSSPAPSPAPALSSPTSASQFLMSGSSSKNIFWLLMGFDGRRG